MRSLPLRRLLPVPLAVAVLALPGRSTWSVVAVNTRTGEVAVASATCVKGEDLRRGVPVVFAGRGAAAAQSVPDGFAKNRTILYMGIGAGLTPDELLDAVSGDPAFEAKQYGICTLNGAPVTHIGQQTGEATHGVAGTVGEFRYAIQGNVLTDDVVVLAAETAFRATDGDMGQRLIAAMEAARAFGGDGRCSCNSKRPTSCGAPPPSFTKSAHIGFLIVARDGDKNVACEPNQGCARGSYYMNLNVRQGIDPVIQLRAKYDAWRDALRGKADGVLSRVDAVDALPADGVTLRTVTVRLRDVDDEPLATSGGLLTIRSRRGAPTVTTVGAVTDHGDGTYSFSVLAGSQPGTDTYVLRVDDGVGNKVSLFPHLVLRSDPVEPLHAGYDRVSASAPPRVPFVLQWPTRPGAAYVIAATLNGTHPGLGAVDLALPLNPPLIMVLRGGVDEALLPGTVGHLDATGRAEAAFAPRLGHLLGLVGRRLDWAAVVRGEDGPVATNTTGFTIAP